MTGALSRAWDAHAARMRVHRIDQYLHMVSGCELADAVPQVEDVGRALPFAGVRLAETVEYRTRLCLDLRRVGEEHRGVEVALQGLACRNEFAGMAEIHGPVDAEHVAVEPLHL